MAETDKIIYLKVKSDGKIYRAHQGKLDLHTCDQVLFENDQNQEVASIIPEDCVREEGSDVREEIAEVTVIRKLTAKDEEKLVELKSEAKETLPKCEEKIKSRGLDMNLLDADLSYDGRKLTFYFTAPGRVDFRSLVPDLASSFKKLIRLQQIGSRDKAKFFGGFGRCGQKFCCKNFLKGELENISMDMAFEQNLGQMGANRVTGGCGKLMCCLRYENEHYRKAKKKMPAMGGKVKTPEGEGTVVEQNVMKNKIKVKLSDERIVEVDC